MLLHHRPTITAPSRKRLRSKLGPVAALSLAVAAAAYLAPAALAAGADAGSSSAPPVAASTPNPSSAGYESQGIKLTITSITLANRTITLQFVIQNKRETGVYLAPIAGWGGSAGTIMSTNGAIYHMDTPSQTFSGLSPCYNPGALQSTDDNVAWCLKQSDPQKMTMIDAGQTGVLGIVYALQGATSAEANNNINFVLKFLVRSAPAGNPLSAAVAKPGPPSIVSITFPLVPVGGSG